MRYRSYRVIHVFKRAYISLLMALLPTILILLRPTRTLKREFASLPATFTFRLCVARTSLSKTITAERSDSGEPFIRSAAGSAPNFTIEFVSIDEAFDAFSGRRTLRSVIASHGLSTQGNLAQGVSLTYVFHSVLSTFFFWRSAYARL